MSIFPEDDRPKPKTVHEIGQDLSMLSLAEIDERIAALKAEIERLTEARAQKGRLALGGGRVLPEAGLKTRSEGHAALTVR